MNILIVSQYFWPESFLVNSLATDLVKRGHQVEVLTAIPNYPQGEFFKGYGFFSGPWQEKYNGAQITRVPVLARGRGFFKLALNYFSYVFFGTTIGAFRVKKDFDVIFCFGLSPITCCLPAILLKFIKRKPLVLWVQDLWPESVASVGAIQSPRILNLIGKLVKFIYKHCDLLLVQSDSFRESVTKWGGDLKKIIYIPNWAKKPEGEIVVPDWLKEPPKGFKIIFAGNIGKVQDIPTLLGAAEILKTHNDIHWMIVGDGSEKNYLDTEIHKRGLNHCVHTYGRKPNEDMPALFSIGDAMLVSLKDESNLNVLLPSKVQSYMASSKPVIAAINGETARIIETSQAGVSCNAENPQQLAQAVLKMYQLSESARQQMGSNGFRFFEEHFEQDRVIDKIETICTDLCRKSDK